jgi:hypothetical protein
MHIFRRLIKHKKLTGILLFGLLLRSLIASGFMIDANPTDGSLFSVIICNGPAGINAIEGLSNKSSAHEHHHAVDNDKHEHVTEDHGFSACSFWSSSGQSILADVFYFAIKNSKPADEAVIYQTPFIHRLTNPGLFPRAPPVLS